MLIETWSYGDWSDCSKPCGFSYKSRVNKCVSGCDETKNQTVTELVACNVNDCGYYGKIRVRVRLVCQIKLF